MFSIFNGQRNDGETELKDVELYMKKADCLSNPQNVMTEHVFGEPAHVGPWSDLETEQLVNVLMNGGDQIFRSSNGGINWSHVSRYVPGRNGVQFQRKYQALRANGEFDDIESLYSTQFQFHQIPALNDDEEKILSDEFSHEIECGHLITKSQIAEAAREMYYRSISIVQKALQRHFWGQKIFDDTGNVKPEFADDAR